MHCGDLNGDPEKKGIYVSVWLIHFATGWWDGLIDSVHVSLNTLPEMVKGREAWCAAVHRAIKSQPRRSDWTMTRN